MKVQFLSVYGWRPDRSEDDTVSLLVNGEIMVDTGWSAVRNLLRAGRTPEDVRTLLFTHMHQDHYIALPQMIFYQLNNRRDASMAICGPDRVREVVDQSLALAGWQISYADCPVPAVRRLSPGERLETGGLVIDTCASDHAVPGLCYRFTEKASGHSVVYTGDTAFTEEIAAFAAGCDALIHEQSLGARRRPEASNQHKHSSAEDAALCARQSGAGRLYLVHTSRDTREESLEAARAVFPDSVRPENLDEIEL